LDGAWVGSLGLRHSAYALANTHVGMLGVERYGAAWRAAYTAFTARTLGSGTGVAHRLQLDRYYDGEASRIGVAIGAGRGVEYLGPADGAVSTDVRNLSLSGQHALNAQWAVSWELLRHVQGELYRRHGFGVGIRHRF
jgi:YaiO family outer membrane protein